MLGRRVLVSLLGLLLLLGGFTPVWGQGQLINGNRTITGGVNYCLATGSVNAYLCALDPPITAYVVGQCFRFQANASNTTAVTLNVNGAGAKVIQKTSGGVRTDVVSGDILSGQVVEVCYDGTAMQAQSLGGGGGGGVSLTILDEGSPQIVRSKLNFLGAGVGCIDNPGLGSTDCTIPGGTAGGGVPYGVDFTAQTTVTVPGTTHGLGTKDLHMTVYDTSSPRVKEIVPNSKEVNPSTFDVVITFAQAQSGRLVLSAASSAAGTGMADPGSNGLLVRTAPLTTLARTLTGTANRLVCTNGNGVAGNPTCDTGSDIPTLSGVETFTGVKTFSGVNLGTNTLRTTYPNEVATGTTNGLLAKLVPTSNPATVTRAALSDLGVLGVVVSGGGTSGSAQVATHGQVACTFENAATSGNLVLVGTTTAGMCRDSGVTQLSLVPASSQVLGRVIDTGGAGTRLAQLWGPGLYGTLINLAANVVGILPAANGGSGSPSLTGVLLGNGTSPFTSTPLPTGLLVGTTAVQDVLNKRYVKRVLPLTPVANVVTLNSDTTDMGVLTALAAATTFANPTGTPVDGQVIVYRVITATPQNVSWGTLFRGSTSAALPTVTSGGGLEDYFAFIRNATANKFDYQNMNRGY